jgi:hypothetical protein
MFFLDLPRSSYAWVTWMAMAFLAFLTTAGADRIVVIEDWMMHAASQRGIPSG